MKQGAAVSTGEQVTANMRGTTIIFVSLVVWFGIALLIGLTETFEGASAGIIALATAVCCRLGSLPRRSLVRRRETLSSP
jgi:hypothetical protein